MRIVKHKDLERLEKISMMAEKLTPEHKKNQIVKDLLWLTHLCHKYMDILEKEGRK